MTLLRAISHSKLKKLTKGIAVANTAKPKEVNATSALFQGVFIVLTSLVMFILIYGALEDFKSKDEMPQLYHITPAKAREFGGTPGKVTVGLQISSFSEFDILDNHFAFEGTIWFEFDPSTTSLDIIGKFSFEKGEITYISAPSTRIIGGKLFARYNVRVEMRNNLEHHLFPLNDHTIYIVLDNIFVSPSEIVFDSSVSHFILSKGIFLSGWTEHDRHVYTGYSKARLEQFNEENVIYNPRVIFAIDYRFRGIRQTLTILLPLLLIFFISIFSLAMEPVEYYKTTLSISTGSITGLLAYRFVIENLSPKVGYFMLSDWLFFLFLTVSSIIFFLNTKTLSLTKREKEIATVILHGVVIAVMVYLFNFQD